MFNVSLRNCLELNLQAKRAKGAEAPLGCFALSARAL
jgi:hypothetical protein